MKELCKSTLKIKRTHSKSNKAREINPNNVSGCLSYPQPTPPYLPKVLVVHLIQQNTPCLLKYEHVFEDDMWRCDYDMIEYDIDQ